MIDKTEDGALSTAKKRKYYETFPPKLGFKKVNVNKFLINTKISGKERKKFLKKIKIDKYAIKRVWLKNEIHSNFAMWIQMRLKKDDLIKRMIETIKKK